MPIAIRHLNAHDIPRITPIVAAAYGRSDARLGERLEHALHRPTHTALFAQIDGVPAGTVFAERYGDIAYVGGMAVEPGLQRRGIGAALMATLLAEIEAAGVRTTLLDSTKAGERLYRGFGFVRDGEVAIWERPGDDAPHTASRLHVGHDELLEIAAFDAGIFGADRTPIVLDAAREAPDRVALERDACGAANAAAFARDVVIGPWIAREPAAAIRVLDRALTCPFPEGVRLFIPCENRIAASIAADRDFREVRRIAHMRRGPLARRDPTAIYGQLSLGHG